MNARAADAATMPSDVFRRRMKDTREEHGVSQRELARRLAVLGVPISQSAIALIEGGKPAKRGQGPRQVSLDEAITIAAALGVPPQHLYEYERPRSWHDYLVERAELSDDEAWRAEQVRRQEAGVDDQREED